MDTPSLDEPQPTILTFILDGERYESVHGSNLIIPPVGRTVQFSELNISKEDVAEDENVQMDVDNVFKVDDVIYEYIRFGERNAEPDELFTVQHVRVLLEEIKND